MKQLLNEIYKELHAVLFDKKDQIIFPDTR
jgi:hypothetical protein